MFSVHLSHFCYSLKPVISPTTPNRSLTFNMPKVKIMKISPPQTRAFQIIFYNSIHLNLKYSNL